MWVSTPTQKPALISRPVDFWLLGGASLLVLAVLLTYNRLAGFHVSPWFWVFWAPYIRIAIEYPHLFASYRLAYAPEKGLWRKNLWPMAVAPALLLAWGAGCILARDLIWFGPAAAKWFDTSLKFAVHVVFIGFGWHRLRQVWGCMVIYARYDQLEFGRSQRLATHAFLFSMWIFGYAVLMRTQPSFDFFGVGIEPLLLPDGIVRAIAWGFGIAWIYFIFEVFVKNAYIHRRLPGLNFMIPMTALIFWWAALSLEPAFFFYLAPAFHALQYMNVVWAVDEGTWRRRGLTFLGLIALGLLIERTPQIVPSLPKETAVIAVAYIMLSLHHYLLDSIIWKSSGEAWQKLVPAR